MNWYAKKTGNDAHPQGLIIDEDTGRNVAVAYDNKDMHLLAAAPKLLEALELCHEVIDYVGAENMTEHIGVDRVTDAYRRAREAINQARGNE